MSEHIVTPVSLERDRLRRARRSMDAFCDDLAEMCDRPERDELTQEIYLAAQRAGERLDEGPPAWVKEASKAVDRLVAKTRWAHDEVPKEEIERNEADVVVCLERADDFFAPHVPEQLLRVKLAMCLYDFAFAGGDQEGDDQEDSDEVALVMPEQRPLAAVEHASMLMLARTLRWGGTVLAAIGIFVTGAVWLVPMVFIAWLASWMLIDKKALNEAAEPRALSPAQAKQDLVADSVKDRESQRRLTGPVRAETPEEAQDLWGTEPDVSTLFASPQGLPVDSRKQQVGGVNVELLKDGGDG